MFEPTDRTVLTLMNGAYTASPVSIHKGQLFIKKGTAYYNIKQHGLTSNPKMRWLYFAEPFPQHYNTVGYMLDPGLSPKKLKEAEKTYANGAQTPKCQTNLEKPPTKAKQKTSVKGSTKEPKA